jgi:CDP-diacylglycerol--glycerol-3-phosphate 3-phosphatidyltransferase
VNLPNVLTVVRILLVPVLVAALLTETNDGDLVAAVIFAVASITDYVDGWYARSRNIITTFGKAMDPIADKLLVIAGAGHARSLDRLGVWVAAVVIARELAVTVARRQAPGVIPAAAWGKWKTTVQIAAIFFLILLDPSPLWVDLLVYAMVAITIVSAIDFFRGMRNNTRTEVGQEA